MLLNVLGVMLMFVFCGCVIALAASITWLVVKYSPSKASKTPS